MGLQSHAAEVIEEAGYKGGIDYIFYTYKGNIRVRCRTPSQRNEIYSTLRTSAEFCPKKIGKYIIGFRPMSDCGLPLFSR